MGLSNTAIKELRHELECQKAYRTAVEERIGAIQCILDSGERVLTAGGKARPGRSFSTDTVSPRPSLRANILRTLQQLSKATPAELTARLQQDGVQVGGATSLRERVWHELSRLRRNDFIRRTRGGRYQLRQAKQSLRLAVPKPADPKSDTTAMN